MDLRCYDKRLGGDGWENKGAIRIRLQSTCIHCLVNLQAFMFENLFDFQPTLWFHMMISQIRTTPGNFCELRRTISWQDGTHFHIPEVFV